MLLLIVEPLRKRGRSASIAATGPGIPLGTVTAQIASKSFWTKDQLDESLRQMTHSMLIELSNSSQLNHWKDQLAIHLEENPGPESDREWATPPRSSIDGHKRVNGYYTPPYLSPGITRKLKPSNEERLFLQA